MELLIDIGNTRIKWACARDDQLFDRGAMVVKDFSENAIEEAMENFSTPDTVWISNVSHGVLLERLVSFLERRFAITPKLVQVTEHACDIQNNYRDQASLGIDRWVAAIGARTFVEKGNVIVIDAGTAITIDWLSLCNTYEGGVILPGTELMHDSLVGNTAGIDSSYAHRDQIIGTTTSECVNSGVGFGLGGAVDRVVEEISFEITKKAPKLLKDTDTSLIDCCEDIEIVVTGGGSCSIKSHAIDRAIVEPNLVLLGLLRIARAQDGKIAQRSC